MPKTGHPALLRPEDSIVVLIDHEPYQFANLHSHEPTMIVNNVVGLAKGAKVFGVPTILTTVIEDRGGNLIVTDASGGVSAEAHDMAVRRLVQAGAVPITWMAVISEWQRDWARVESATELSLASCWSMAARAASRWLGNCNCCNRPGPERRAGRARRILLAEAVPAPG